MVQRITVATLNVAAASKERAKKILETWISSSSYDVYVLTETSEGTGTQLITAEFHNAGWAVFQRPTTAKDRGVTVISRIRAMEALCYPPDDPAPGRSIMINLHTLPQIQIVGMYVPNRGNDSTKTERKRRFLDTWLHYLDANKPANAFRILLGDLNVVPTMQRPAFLPQQPFEYDWYAKLTQQVDLYDGALAHNKSKHEYTWISPTREGYTYDHIMLQKALYDRVVSFQYDHSPRLGDAITDHSALVLSLNLDSVDHFHRRGLDLAIQMKLF